MEKEFRKK
jgi:uncharacterized protein (DUF2344 family)